MKMHKYFILAIAVLLIQLIVVLILGKSLPADARLPIHWNINNEIDGWASKNAALIPFWLFNLGLFLLMMFSGRLVPVFKQNRERYEAIIPLMTFGLTFFFAIFHIYILLLGINPEWQSKTQIVFIMMGGLFIFMGNILPRTPRNFIAGYKLPWTLYNDEIWRRTHRLSGWCFVTLGLVMLVRGVFNILAPWMNFLMLIFLIGLVFLPIIYSFVLYRQGKGEE
jgi:uncharacterized membrane protein